MFFHLQNFMIQWLLATLTFKSVDYNILYIYLYLNKEYTYFTFYM